MVFFHDNACARLFDFPNIACARLQDRENLEAENTVDQSAQWRQVRKTLQTIALAYAQQNLYECSKAVASYQRLSPAFLDSPWILCQLGRCCMELAEYKQAVAHFELCRRRFPYQVAGMEYYSTALWHLKKELDLSVLGKCLVSFDRFC
jgi:anaphase-promoting complex subunit 3